MDFYSRQAGARRQTRRLLFAFFVTVLLVAFTLDLVVFSLISSDDGRFAAFAPLELMRREPGLAIGCTLLILAVIFLASLYKSVEYRGGGGVVARSLGGVLVSRDTGDLKRKRLHNIVEEMSIASGVPLPEIYVLEQEAAINAFAAGHTPANAAIAVTQGALDKLNRDELQGVIAHEFSHILNGDMRLNVQLMGWLFGLFVIAIGGRLMLRHTRGSGRSAGALLAAGVGLMVVGYTGLFFGRLLQAAVSRERERLADASSVQFTRNPEGLKGALVKIAGLVQGSKIVAPNADQAAHMLFAPGLRRFFQTHPSLAERIRALDPRFDVKRLPGIAANALKTIPAFDSSELADVQTSHAAPSVVALQPAVTATIGAQVPADAIATQVGHVQTVHIEQAHALRLALPESLREFVESSGRSRALVLALLLSRNDAVRERQLSLLGRSLDEAELNVVRDTLGVAGSLEPMLRLPALLQIFPALRRLSVTERRSLAKLTDDLIRADARVDVFEFCLAHLLATLIRDELEARAPHGKLSLDESESDIQVLFVTLATFGAADSRQARMAYEAGMQTVMPMHRPPYLAIENWAQRLGESLRRLEKLQPFAKKVVIEGLARTIAHDGVLNVSEAELLRTVCAVLHCPLPPLLPGLICVRQAL